MSVNYDERRWEQKSSHQLHPSVRFRNRLILKTLKNIKFNTLIDAWCWDGFLLNILKKNFPEIIYSWVDVSDYIIDENKKKYKDIEFFQWDLWNNHFNINKKFEVVICSEVIEHIKDWKQVISNLSKIVNNNWYCILTTQSGKRYKSDLNIWHLKHFQLEELENEFIKHWFKIIKSYKRGFPFYNMQKRLYEKIENKAKKVQQSKATLLSKILFELTYISFILSIKSKKLGPQLFLLVQKA